MNKVFIVENDVNDHKIFESFYDAVMFAVDYIDAGPFTKEDQGEMYKELILSIAQRDVEKWGKGYCLDEMLWCWEVPFYAIGKYERKEKKSQKDTNCTTVQEI